jgi:hypothetical protein
MEFRQKALVKLASRDEFMTPTRLASSQGWLIVAVVAVIMAGSAVWAVEGSLPRSLRAPGILTHSEGSHTLQSPAAGQVDMVFVAQGATFAKSSPVLRVRDGGRTEVVRTVAAGRATAVLVKMGQMVSVGSPLVVIERIDSPQDKLVAVLYVPGERGPAVSPGMLVDLTVKSAPAERYGVLRGKITSVGPFPETRARVAAFLGDEQLGERFTTDGEPVAVMVALQVCPNNPSGYAWSTPKGPPFAIGSRALVLGAIHLEPARPISWVLGS